MQLILTRLPADKVAGIYNGNRTKNPKTGKLELLPFNLLRPIDSNGRPTMPDHLRWLHPSAARSFLEDLADFVVVSDMLRSAESSLEAVRRGRGALPPGYSGHNYGFSIDIAIIESMHRAGFATKADFDAYMNRKGWFCHRMDHRNGHEAWHYNYLGDGYTDADGTCNSARRRFALNGGNTNGHLQSKIRRIYGKQMALTTIGAQVALAEMRLYKGAIDGIFGSRSQEALRMFQRSIDLKATGKLDARTMRTLAFVTCTVKEVPL